MKKALGLTDVKDTVSSESTNNGESPTYTYEDPKSDEVSGYFKLCYLNVLKKDVSDSNIKRLEALQKTIKKLIEDTKLEDVVIAPVFDPLSIDPRNIVDTQKTG